MVLPSEDSIQDYDRLNARVQHDAHDPAPQSQQQAESDFAAVGGQFVEGQHVARRESYPHSLDISEGEDTTRQTRSPSDAGAFPIRAPEARGRSSLGRPRTPPTTQFDRGPYLPESEFRQNHARYARMGRVPHSRNSGHPTRSSRTSLEEQSDTTVDRLNDNGGSIDRGRSSTPTPLSNPPSRHSEDTEEEHGEGIEPPSPNPYSAYYPYNPHTSRDMLDSFGKGGFGGR